MKQRISIIVASGLLAACNSSSVHQQVATPDKSPVATPRVENSVSRAFTVNDYKREIAERIALASPDKIFAGRPQALLRSVIVVKYVIDAHGNLVRTEVMRSNHDGVAEGIALNTLRIATPFPKPAASLLRHGKLELMETWLFNNDGRFQLRTTAEPQIDQ